MVVAGDFKNGITFEMDGNVYQVIEFQHVKPGKGAAFVRTKLRNVITGSVIEKTFSTTVQEMTCPKAMHPKKLSKCSTRSRTSSSACAEIAKRRSTKWCFPSP